MYKTTRRNLMKGMSAAALAAPFIGRQAWAAGTYDQGVSDTEIILGQTQPYSGPGSAYGTIGKCEAAYWKMVNEAGGINGRKITLLSEDDAFNPSLTVKHIRKLVESDGVFAIFNSLGTGTNLAVRSYLNEKGIPQLFCGSASVLWANPKEYPWTIGFHPAGNIEASIYGKHIMATVKDPKIAILYLNDDSGKDYLQGLKAGLGKENESKIVGMATYELSDPTVDSQVVQLQSSGANVFFNGCAAKYAAQAIRKAHAIGWSPVQYVANFSTSVEAVLKPAGLDASQGLLTAAYMKDPNSPENKSKPDFIAWKAFMDKYYPEGSVADVNNVFAYAVVTTMHELLKRCGDNLTRANLMKEVTHMRGFNVPMLVDGVQYNTSSDDYNPIQSMHLQQFKGENWELFGDLISNET